jgi:DNA-binding beta-propeller fold protein YncE
LQAHARLRLALAGLIVPAGVLAAPDGGAPAIETIAGSGRPGPAAREGAALDFSIDQPFGVELGPGGHLYICEMAGHRLLRLDLASGRIEVAAGSGRKGREGDGGPAVAAALDEPYEVRFDSAGNTYIVEMQGAVVRKVDARTGAIRTIAGTGEPGFSGDGGPAVKARLSQPHSIALDGAGGLFIADIGNHRIRRVDLETGLIETVAGNGGKELPEEGMEAAGHAMLGPRALAVSGGALWIALREGHSVWRMDLKTRKLARIAGTGKAGHRDGPAREATFNGPKGIAVGPKGDLFVADTENHAIRRIDVAAGTVTTIAGAGPASRGYGGDGGPAAKAKLDRPHGIAVGPDGAVYVGDSENGRVRRIAPRGGK